MVDAVVAGLSEGAYDIMADIDCDGDVDFRDFWLFREKITNI